jgi:hypothetical protein
MLFNSIDFVIFLPLVLLIYWFVVNRSLKLQNFFIVAASYVFYGGGITFSFVDYIQHAG